MLQDPQWNVPSLEEIHYPPLLEPDRSPYRGGETQALQRLEEYCTDSIQVLRFSKPDTDPTAFEKPSTTLLSPYLKFGCLSARTFYRRLHEVYKGKKHTLPPVSLLGQLYWREFFYLVGYSTPHFDRMAGNPICMQVYIP